MEAKHRLQSVMDRMKKKNQFIQSQFKRNKKYNISFLLAMNYRVINGLRVSAVQTASQPVEHHLKVELRLFAVRQQKQTNKQNNNKNTQVQFGSVFRSAGRLQAVYVIR